MFTFKSGNKQRRGKNPGKKPKNPQTRLLPKKRYDCKKLFSFPITCTNQRWRKKNRQVGQAFHFALSSRTLNSNVKNSVLTFLTRLK